MSSSKETDEEEEEYDDDDDIVNEEDEEVVQETAEQGNPNIEDEPKTETDDILQIQLEDVEEDIEFWNQAVVCFILGANPPWEVVEGFIRRIWTKYNIDKISFMPNGIFFVRFKTMEMKEKVLSSEHYLFDNKPMIVKPWTRDLEMTKEDVKSVPAWVQIHKLPLKFWGKGLPKIASLLGKFIKSDVATEERTRLGYAHVMVELVYDQDLPSQIAFKDENGSVIRVDVEYEWRPIKCKKCLGMGQEMEHYRKGTQENAVKKPVKQLVNGTVTPRKRLVRMHRQEGDRSGYSTETFGAQSYKEILASPSKRNGADNGNENNGYHNNGRIWILWDPKLFRIQFLEYNAQFIHMTIEALVSRSVFYFTMIYAFNGIQDKTPLWDHLRRFSGQVEGPWTIAVDIPAIGSIFTWNNNQKPEDRIYIRIDRFMTNKAWSDHFPNHYANFLPEVMLHHTPCLISSLTQVQNTRSFKYYNMWGASKDFLPFIKRCRTNSNHGTPLFTLAKNLKLLKPALKALY
ncbi:uncharacterized protein LOC141628380 [Silene latifolia]|uniref:uncharacterized protein LOC141628380 n=1 Tax=Silene latifolia TaxID=37657 RepID=UPI003D783A2B